MPYLENLPLGWLKLAEIAPLLQILHLCLVIDSKQSTAGTFESIQKLATNAYRQFFDENFEPLPLYSETPIDERDRALQLNNRAAIKPIFKQKVSFSSPNAVLQNKELLRQQRKLI